MNALLKHIDGKQHVIWDWNGTLLNDLEHAIETVNRLLWEENLPLTNLEVYRRAFRFPVVDYYRDLGFDTSREKFLELCEKFNVYFKDGLDRCSLWPNAVETLYAVKSSGKTQSILSATEQKMLEESARRFEIDHLFDHLFGIFDKAAASKVDRGHQLMAAAGVEPAATIMIGDTDHDLEVGQALGIDVILIEHGHQCPTRLREVHSKVVKVF